MESRQLSSMNTYNIYSYSQSLLRHLLPFLVASSIVQLTRCCEFPLSVQTNASIPQTGRAREWRGRIKEQFNEYSVQLAIDSKTMRTVSTGSNMGRTSHTRACVRQIEGGKYLVAHEEPGQQGARYSCVQFLMRSDDVMQIRSAPVENLLKADLCNDNRLELDKWLIVDAAHVGRNPLPCPLRGGYLVGMFDKIRAKGVCDAWNGEVRLESECTAGEGLTFYFRTQKCVPEDLLMFSTQSVLCLANWAHGIYTFSLLKHTELPYYWLYRLPSRAITTSDSFTSYLFKDLIAEDIEYSEESLNYIRMDLTRDVTTDTSRLCADDYEICARVQPPCTEQSAHLALVCPITCGVCTSRSYSFCNLPSDWSGQWSDLGGGVSKKARLNGVAANSETPPIGQAANKRRTVTVNTTSITIQEGAYDAESYKCIAWNSGRDFSNHMLVRTFERGCRPRYTCVKQVKRSPSLLYLRLSHTSIWPLVKYPTDPIDCSSFIYDHPHYGDPQKIDFSITSRNALMLVETGRTNRLQPVQCSPPSAEYLDYGVSFSPMENQHRRRRISPADCYASLSLTQSQTSFSFISDGCQTNSSSLPVEESYDCLESSPLDSDQSARIIISQSSSQSNNIYCWLFLKPTSSSVTFYLLNISHCHMILRHDARLDRIHYYLASFSSRSRRVTNKTFTAQPAISAGLTLSNRVAEKSGFTSPISSTVQTTSVGTSSGRLDELGDDKNTSFTLTDEPPTTNPFVISSAVVILAILQTVVLCGCL